MKMRLEPGNAMEVLLSRRLGSCENVAITYLSHFPQKPWKDFLKKIGKLDIKTLEVNVRGFDTEWPESLIPALKNIEEVILWGDTEDSIKRKLLETIAEADRSSLKLRRLQGLSPLNLDEKLVARAAIRLESLDAVGWGCDQVIIDCQPTQLNRSLL